LTTPAFPTSALSPACWGPRLPLCILVLALCLSTLGLCSSAVAATVAGRSVDGPSPSLQSVGAVALARDADGAIVYVKTEGAVSHPFVTRLLPRGWAAPERVDGSLEGTLSTPVVAAALGGRLTVAFVDNGALYASVAPSAGRPFSAPQLVASPATNPALAMAQDGTGYLSFTVPGRPAVVRVAHLDRQASSFVVVGAPLNLDPSASAGDGLLKRSRVAVSSDASALVTWGEDGAGGATHVVARRVIGTQLGSAPRDLTLDSLDGRPGGSADSPEVRIEDVSSYALVTFRESFSDGSTVRSRAIARRLVGSEFDAPVAIDGLAFGGEGADVPSLDFIANGVGLTGVGLSTSHEVVADLVDQGALLAPRRVDSLPNAIAPSPVEAVGDNGSGLIAWRQSLGPSIRARPLDHGAFTAEALLSSPALGPVDVADGLGAGADHRGNTVVAFLQGAAGARRLVVASSAQAPRAFRILSSAPAGPSRRPVIRWQAAKDLSGAPVYRVAIDGVGVASTTATHLRPRASLAKGVHRVRVVAVNRFGVSRATTSRVRVGG